MKTELGGKERFEKKKSNRMKEKMENEVNRVMTTGLVSL